MLRTTASRVANLVRKAVCPPILGVARTSAPRKARLGLESLDGRVLPAVNTFLGGPSFDAASWSAGRYPTYGDDVVFDGGYTSDPCMLQAIGPFGSLRLVNGYAGTVTLGNVTYLTGAFEMTGGAVAMAQSWSDLHVNGTFTWTGGTLNSNPNGTTVFVKGGGAITLPGVGNTLTSGSTLDFSNPSGVGVKTTTITGGGTLQLNGTGTDGIKVQDNTKVQRTVQQAATGAILSAAGVKTLTLTASSSTWGYAGKGNDELGLRVSNAGRFYLNGEVSVKLSGGTATAFAYTQNAASIFLPSLLEIQSGCVLDVSGSKGANVVGGQVLLTCNSALTVDQQFASIKGKYTMSGGNINFEAPIDIDGSRAWVTFGCTEDVTWSGGSFNPNVDGGGILSTFANRWNILGTLTIDASQSSKPTITPNTLFAPAGQGTPKRTWPVIDMGEANGKIEGDAPQVPSGWELVPETVGNVKKGYAVKYTGS